MGHKHVRIAGLFCSLDRTPFVAVTAILVAIFVFAVLLIAERPRVGAWICPRSIIRYMCQTQMGKARSFLRFLTTAGFFGDKTKYRLATCPLSSETAWDASQKPRYT